MSGLPSYSVLSNFCTCENCLYGYKESCKLTRMHHRHSQTVGVILASGSHRMLEIGFTANNERHYVTCHSSLICYWSATIRNAIYPRPNPIHRIWIDFEQNGEQTIVLWKQIVQWCYTGKLFDPNNIGDASIGYDDDIEMLWTAAISLEMNELANYCMHLIIMKYSWGFSARANPTQKIHPRDCPFDARGPYHAFIKCHKLGIKHRKLLEFMEGLISAGGPMATRKRKRANNGTIQSWLNLLDADEDFRDWVDLLGGVENERSDAVLPTHFNQWHRYMVPLLPRFPENIHEWSALHDAMTKSEGHLVELHGVYGNGGDLRNPDYGWAFYVVPADWV
ncbi:hypothetical protein F4781DRAFT_445353 [Annulohypoxylon bovei var. microspora]|nr:hypothetical protein F4781DRAFT_445353 [Annulohypoxylon bovei var. microspora]